MRVLRIARLLALIVPLLMAGTWAFAAVACPVDQAAAASAEQTAKHDCTPKGALASVQDCVAICHASILPNGPQIVLTVAFHPVVYVLDQDEAKGAGADPDVPPPRQLPAT